MILINKHIVLGVTGGIAAYKSVELLRLITAQNRARVVMTNAAMKFVGPVTFQALSENAVYCDVFQNDGGNAAIHHIDWAREADAVVIAPATADIIGKLAGGIADDALSTLMPAVTAPVLICPSMNSHMYEHPAVQRNINQLNADGYHILKPESGELACGTSGPGRLPEPPVIFDRLTAMLSADDFLGKKVLVTAGPTREPLDPVRYVGNPSSGKMGFAVARAAEHRGADVILISGPTHLTPPLNTRVIRVQTALEMHHAVMSHVDDVDIVIKAAAVSDYRPESVLDHKMKKKAGVLTVSMARNPDILEEIGKRKKGLFLVGFAAETRNLDRYARDKLRQKNLDMMVGNLVNEPGSGFGSETNAVTFYYRNGDMEKIGKTGKDRVAHHLLDRIADRQMRDERIGK